MGLNINLASYLTYNGRFASDNRKIMQPIFRGLFGGFANSQQKTIGFVPAYWRIGSIPCIATSFEKAR